MPDQAPALERQAVERATATIDRVPEGMRKEFRALAREFPSRVQSDGIVRAVVELAGRGASGGEVVRTSAAGVLLGEVLEWLQEGPFPRDHGTERDGLHPLAVMIRSEPEHLAWAEEHLQRYLRWVKRLAEIQFSPAGQSDEGDIQ
jgi:hypothetical protein